MEDILDFSKLEFNKFELNCEYFSINDAIEDVFDMIRMQAESKGIALIKKVIGSNN